MTERGASRRLTGAVSLEFLIAFPPLWVFCLCVFQLVLLARADLIVRHAAESAARSAAVVLPDDPARYHGEPEMSVSKEPEVERGAGTPKDAGSSKAGVLGAVLSAISLEGLSRRETIGVAAEVPLLPLGETPRGLTSKPTVHSAIGPTRLVSPLVSARGGLELSFPNAVEDRVQGPEVTVRLTFAYRCSVPIARHILCDRDSVAKGNGLRVWQFDHSTTMLIHDAPYSYHPSGES